jgi:Ca-activated chloride channel homolog
VKFAHPLWLFGALFALAVAGLLVLGAFAGVRALRRFGEPAPVENLLTARVGPRRALKGALSVLALGACFVALAQPQYGWGTRRIPATNLDVIVVLDYSKSMYARDVAPNRIERAKVEVAELIGQLAGARFGAVAFAGEPLSFPLTSDGGAIAQFFRQLTPHDMPVGGTAIARALEAGRSLLERDPQSSKHRRVMLLVTDGEDLEGDPERSAQAAKEAGVGIYVVQIGGRTPEPIPDMDEQGVDRGIRRSEQGQVMTTALSAEGERVLGRIAEITGGNVVRSEAGSTGIDEVTRRLRAMMTEELSERVETVYADVYAYPLVVALLLFLVEAFLPEVRRRAARKASPNAPERAGGAVQSGASVTALLFWLFGCLLGVPTLSGCESAAVDRVFTRHSPDVDDAIEVLRVDAGAAEEKLTKYLGIAPCENGNIAASSALAEKAQASFDLGLALFRVAERFGGRFDADPARAAEDAALLARRGEEVSCALSVVQQVALRPALPIDLRAEAHYLLGNLEFARREYKAAVASYDKALELVPGDEASTALAVGRHAAHNRALALRLAEEDKPDPPPDAGAPPPSDAGNQQQDEPQDPEEPKDEPEQDKDDQEQNKDEQEQKDQEKSEQKDEQKPQPEGDEPSDQAKNEPPPDPEQKEPQSAPPPEEKALSRSQDEKMLDQLERAPTVQQEYARAQRGRMRRVVEDK